MFKRHPTDTQLIFLTLTLVLLMGIPTVHALTEPESEVVVVSQRQPASISPAVLSTGKASQTSTHFAKLDLNCRKRSTGEFKVEADFIQFQGKTCLAGVEAAEVQIINRSNGYTGSVFDSGSDRYQTDLIQLQKGSNEISIRYLDASGKYIEEVLKVQTSQL